MVSRPKRLSDFSLLSFDCYGTLIDWESGIVAGLRRLAEKAEHRPGPRAVLETHARLEALVQRENPAMPYSRVLAEVYERAAAEWGAPASVADSLEYGKSAGRWRPFPDTREALGYLKRHFKLAILSNVDHANFSRTAEQLGVEFDAVFLAEDIGDYKPSMKNFRYMLDALEGMGIAKEDILHTAESLFHDHIPANRIGLASCLIHRRAGKDGFGATSPPAEMPEYDFRFTSLAEMAESHRREIAAGKEPEER